MEVIRRSIAFILGLFILAAGATDNCSRVGDIAVGLLLMGIFTVPDLVKVVRGGTSSEGD